MNEQGGRFCTGPRKGKGMKQIIRPIFCVMGIAGVVAIWLWMMISAYKPTPYPVSYYTPDYVESYTVGSFDQLRICKVYYLAPEDTIDRISTEDFQEYGRCFSLLELTKESCDKTDIYTAVFQETRSSS